MVNQFQKKVLVMALYAGELMMKNGAEVYRVEETIERICRACKIDYVECFATTTGIFLSLDSGKSDEDVQTFIKRIKYSNINLKRISQLNEFSREFTTTDLSVDDGFQRLKEIAAQPRYPTSMRILGAVLVGLALCPIMGGGIWESICAGVISGGSYVLSMFVEMLHFPKFIRTFVGCCFSTALAILVYSLGICDGMAATITASVAIYLPGVAITNAARDMMAGDMLAGVSRFTEAILLAMGIAGGVGIILKFYTLWTGGYLVNDSYSYNIWVPTACTAFAASGLCILFNSPKSTVLYTCIIGACGQLVMKYLVSMDQHTTVACFGGACALAILAEFGSRAGKDATTIFIIPGIIPFVPGSLIYGSMSKLLEGDISSATSLAVTTLVTALTIAAALVVVSSLTRLLVRIIRKIKSKFHPKGTSEDKSSS